MPLPAWHHDALAARLPFLRRRALLTAATRSFFSARGYMEVETPYVVPAPGEEVHLKTFATQFTTTAGAHHPLWLHTSPEFAMKRLLAGGSGPIFQLARVWRNEEGSARHAPEFTMLEWYRPGAGLDGLMDETEAFCRAVLPPVVTSAGVTTDLARFERLTVAEAFHRHVGADVLATEGDANALARSAGSRLRQSGGQSGGHSGDQSGGQGGGENDGGWESWEDLFFRLLLERVEPHLGRSHPTFLTHWPASQAALALRDPTDPRVALRFELFICGMELANAFQELTDPVEQRARFLADRARRQRLAGQALTGHALPGHALPGHALPGHALPGHTLPGQDRSGHALSRQAGAGQDWPLDEDFLDSLAHLPPCAGIALGFDRLAMLAAGATDITQVLWLPGLADPMYRV